MSTSSAQHGQHDASIPPGTLVRFTRSVAVVDAASERSGVFVWHYVATGETALVIDSPQ